MTTSDITMLPAGEADSPVIHRLAHEIWWPAYGHFIPHGQIRLMLEEMYTEDALARQIASGGRFLIARIGDHPMGFAEYRPKSGEPATMRIEKLYVSPRSQGQGLGRALITHVADIAREAGKTHLELNVNRNNKLAIGFYEKNGFVAVAETDTPYHGYMLNDYVMQKKLTR